MLSSVLWVALSRTILGLTPLFTLPALTRAFTPEWYGVWTQIVTTISFIVPLIGFGFDMGVIRFFSVGFSERKRVRDFYAMATFIALIGLVLIGLAMLSSKFISTLMFSNSELTPYAVLTFVWMMGQAIYNYLISFFRVTGKMRTYAIFDTINGLLVACIMVIVPLVFHSIWLMLVGIILNQMVFITIFLLLIYRQIGLERISFSNLGMYLKYGLPLVPNSLFLWLVNSSGRYFLTHFKGLAEVGVYAAGSTIANVMTLFFMPISFVLFPIISKLWEEKKAAEVAANIALANRWYLTIAIPGALGLSFLAKPLVGLLSAKAFSGGADVIFLLTLANLFYGIYQINLYGALLLQKNLRLTGLFASAGILNVVLNLSLVPVLGTRGAALAMLCSFFFLAGAVFLWTKKAIGFRLDWQVNAKVLLSAGVMVGVLILEQHFLNLSGASALLLQIFIGSTTYTLLLFLTKVVTRDELRRIRKRI
ncbi:MAG: oligosaccharide flippase family protein [Desulfitobacteriaceae bacterium]